MDCSDVDVLPMYSAMYIASETKMSSETDGLPDLVRAGRSAGAGSAMT